MGIAYTGVNIIVKFNKFKTFGYSDDQLKQIIGTN